MITNFDAGVAGRMETPFTYCPACGAESFSQDCAKSFKCHQCGFILFMNPSAATAAIIEHDGDVLFAVRAQEPAAGRLDLPGGFVDAGESVEAALTRELDEELGLKDVEAEYMGSFPNTYPYAGVTYQTIDLIYTIKLDIRPALTVADDVAEAVWIDSNHIPFDRIAFTSIRNALAVYQHNLK